MKLRYCASFIIRLFRRSRGKGRREARVFERSVGLEGISLRNFGWDAPKFVIVPMTETGNLRWMVPERGAAKRTYQALKCYT